MASGLGLHIARVRSCLGNVRTSLGSVRKVLETSEQVLELHIYAKTAVSGSN